MIAPVPESLPQDRYPVEPWRLVEAGYPVGDIDAADTLFAIGNGYLGMRPDGAGTFVNGFHETWTIEYPEQAYGLATEGQTIVDVPDAEIHLTVDGEPFLHDRVELDTYERVLDFRTGQMVRNVVWVTSGGNRVRVRRQHLVSLVDCHLAAMKVEVTLLDGPGSLVIASQLRERLQRAETPGERRDQRRARRLPHRVLLPQLHRVDGDVAVLGYRCANSEMTLATGYCHHLETDDPHTVDVSVDEALARTVFWVEAEAGHTVAFTKFVSYHTAPAARASVLAGECRETLEGASARGFDRLARSQADWLERYWAVCDVELDGDAAAQQAVRWNLFQLAQASACIEGYGIAAKGVTGAGYEGHYFWDTEMYVLPFLAYSQPEAARELLRYRWRTLPQARCRARALDERGALYPWRTINGEEASPYYPAGTAQYHIDAAIAFAMHRYVTATGDTDFLRDEGAEILVETARLWETLGFYDDGDDPTFHLHAVTGPDEYSTVVDDNFYTNAMARFHLRFAARAASSLAATDPDAHRALVERTGLGPDEPASWERAADAMHLPYDRRLGIHAQDRSFLDRERWDFEAAPPDRYPLLLHYHPLVIYRHQVLKQPDVVMALYLLGHEFSLDVKRRDFDYYDPLTTGDSSLSTSVQSIVAAEVGHTDLALAYFRRCLYLDLADTHHNASEGVHIAAAGGTWLALVHGFAGMVDAGHALRFAPRLPLEWDRLAFGLLRHGSLVRVELDHEGGRVTVASGEPVPIEIEGEVVSVAAGQSVAISSAATAH